MKNSKELKKIFIMLPIIMSVIMYFSFIVLFVKNFLINDFSLSLLDRFIEYNFRFYILCIGIFVYFLNINNPKFNKISSYILICSFIITFISSFVYFLYFFINSGSYSGVIFDVLYVIGFLLAIIYLSNILKKKRFNKFLILISTLFIILPDIKSEVVTFDLVIRILFVLSYTPYFYFFYSKKKNDNIFKFSINSFDIFKKFYSLIMLLSFVLLFFPAYGYDFGYGYSNYYNYFSVLLSFNVLIVLVSSLLFVLMNTKKIGFYFSILYPIELIMFSISYCVRDIGNCLNFIGFLNIALSILSVRFSYIILRSGDYKIKKTGYKVQISNIKKEGYEMQENGLIYEINGNMGRILKVYEDRCVLSTVAGIKSFALGGLTGATRGDKEFYYSDLTSVQFKNLGISSGYIQFEYAGSRSGNNFTSENSFLFSASIGTKKYGYLKEVMPTIYDYIHERVRMSKESHNETIIQQTSSADELLKFKKLLDDGIITQEEFDAKKKQLLNL